VGIDQVSKLLGHSDIKTTQVYLKFIPDEKRKEIAKLPSLIE
jgi:integrase